ncbi:unnamed protein product [Cochlearia groenlandica]
MKTTIPSWSWWLLGGGGKEKEETGSPLKFLTKINQTKGGTRVVHNKKKKKELELEKFGSSGSNDGPEWSVGWTEPHGPDFESDDGGFLVLVPCYRAVVDGSGNNHQILTAVKNLPNGLSHDGKNYMEKWLSSMQNI